MVDVDVWWTEMNLFPFKTVGWMLENNTIPVFPAMMAGFFLSDISLY
ncbi:hypothetical protein [Serratia marcescens]|nr:hypothetical protein [Serratia marcescens]